MQTISLKEKLDELKRLRRLGQWQAAEAVCEELLREQVPPLDEPSISEESLNSALSVLRERACLYEQSSTNNRLWLESLQLIQALEKRACAPVSQQARTLWKAHLCAKRMDYVAYHLQGEPHLHEALALFKDPSLLTDPTYSNLLGWHTAFRAGDLNRGVALMESALERYSQIKDERSEDMTFTYQLLSLAYDQNGCGDKLRLFLERGRALAQAMKEPAELADLLTFAAARQAVEPEFALDGLKWIEKHYGERHPKLLVLRTAIAGRLEAEAMDEAETYWLESVSKADDPPMGHAIYALTGYGGYLERQDRLSEAEDTYRRAMDIIESYFKPEPLFFIGPQPALALAELLGNQGRLEESAELLRNFIARQEKDDYISALDVEYALETLINVLHRLGRSHETEVLMRKLNKMQGTES